MDAAVVAHERHPWTAIGCAVLIGGILVVLDAIDFSRDPATDTADVVATFSVFGGGLVWFAARWLETHRPDLPGVGLVRAAAAGLAIGALLIGLGSVIYDPFAN